MAELKPCPFCGSDMEDHFIYYKKDKRKILGVRYEICTIECHDCTASIRQAGPTKDKAYRNAIDVWNMRRANNG